MPDVARETALRAVNDAVRAKIEQAFWDLDDVMVALAPDAPQEVADAWTALHKLMTPEFISNRDRIRGLAPTR